MTQVHKRFTAEQVKVLFQGYCQGNISRSDVEEMLGIGKTRIFALLKAYRHAPDAFSIAYHRSTTGRLSEEAESQIKQELLREKALVADKDLPIHDYNYAALVDRLKKQNIQVSTMTVIKRAKALDCYQPKKKGKAHDREVLPFRYYVDNLRGFRFVQKRDSFWRTHHLGTDEIDPQWWQVLRQFKDRRSARHPLCLRQFTFQVWFRVRETWRFTFQVSLTPHSQSPFLYSS